jgi:hypothetical protein
VDVVAVQAAPCVGVALYRRLRPAGAAHRRAHLQVGRELAVLEHRVRVHARHAPRGQCERHRGRGERERECTDHQRHAPRPPPLGLPRRPFHTESSHRPKPLRIAYARPGSRIRLGRLSVGRRANQSGTDEADEDDHDRNRQPRQHDPQRIERVMQHAHVNTRKHPKSATSVDSQAKSDVKRPALLGIPGRIAAGGPLTRPAAAPIACESDTVTSIAVYEPKGARCRHRPRTSTPRSSRG